MEKDRSLSMFYVFLKEMYIIFSVAIYRAGNKVYWRGGAVKSLS